MSESDSDRQVRQYLRDLEAGLRDLPPANRRQMLDDIRAHIRDEQAARGVDATPLILEGLGTPEMIAAEARADFGVRRGRPGVSETATLVLLPIGGLLLPVLGWVIGVVLLWSSAVWTRREKLIGTFVVPGGLLSSVWVIAFFAGMPVDSCDGDACGDGGLALGDVLFLVAAVCLLIAPVVTAVYLARARRAAAAAATN